MDVVDTLDRVEHLEVLAGVPLFTGLSVADLESIADVTSLRALGPDDRVFAQGDPGDEMLIVVEGGVDVIRRGPDGSRHLASLGPGGVVGELSIFRRLPRSADVVAGSDGVTCLVIGARTLEHILQERPQVALGMLAALADKIAVATAPTG